jgi:DNA repair protein RadC
MIVSAKKKKITMPVDLVPVLQHLLESEEQFDREKEHFWAVGLTASNVVQYVDLVSLGVLNRALVHPREVFRLAILKGVAALIVAHNHPSGDCSPSVDDHAVTRQLVAAGQVVGIKVLDHVIVGAEPGAFFSFLEGRQMP